MNLRTEPPEEQLVAIAIVRAQGCVLVQTRREAGPLDGMLEFPGGKTEPGESPQRAVAREVREETGLSLDPRQCSHYHQERFRYPDRKLRLQFFLIDLGERLPVRAGHWLSLQDLDPENFPAANRNVIEKLKTPATG